MTLFRPAVIEAQRRRVYGSVTLHQPARLAAFSAVAVISVAIGTAYLTLGQYARKETVAGWIARAVYQSLYRMHLIAIHGWWRGVTLIVIGHVNQIIRPKFKLH